MKAWLCILSALVALPVFAAADPDADTVNPQLVGTREQASCRFTASDGFDDGPPPRSFDLKSLAQDVALYFGEIASEANAEAGKPLSGEAIAQAIENETNTFAFHRRNYWRRRRSHLYDARRTLADVTAKVFLACNSIVNKSPEVLAACERLPKDRASMSQPLTPQTATPAKLEALEKEVYEVAVAAKEASDLLEHAAGEPFFELEKTLLKQFDKFEVVSKSRGAMDARKEEMQDKLTVAESELYRLEDEVHRNTEAQEDALEEQIEQYRVQIAKLNAGDDVKLENSFEPITFRDSPELRAIKNDKKAKVFIAKNAAQYRSARSKYRAIAESLDREGKRAERITKYDPAAGYIGPRLASNLLERGDEIPVAISYAIEVQNGKPTVAQTTLICGRRKRQEGIAFLASFTPPQPPPPPVVKPPPPVKGKRSLAATPKPKPPPPWPAPELLTKAAARAGIEEPIVHCNTWTLFCDKPLPVE